MEPGPLGEMAGSKTREGNIQAEPEASLVSESKEVLKKQNKQNKTTSNNKKTKTKQNKNPKAKIRKKKPTTMMGVCQGDTGTN